MKITKKNGNTTLYDDDKIANSILKAAKEVPEETITTNAVYSIVDEVFSRLTADNEIITTADVKERTYSVLREKGYPLTAKRYLEYQK